MSLSQQALPAPMTSAATRICSAYSANVVPLGIPKVLHFSKAVVPSSISNSVLRRRKRVPIIDLDELAQPLSSIIMRQRQQGANDTRQLFPRSTCSQRSNAKTLQISARFRDKTSHDELLHFLRARGPEGSFPMPT